MTSDNPKDSPSGTAKLARWALAALPVLLFAVCIAAIHNELADTDLGAVTAAARRLGTLPLVGAIVLAGLSYLAMSFQDVLALRVLKKDVSLRRALGIGLVSNAIGQTAGASVLSAGALRWRFYAPLGLGASEAGYVSFFTEAGFIFGMSALLSFTLIAAPLTVARIGISPGWASAIGVMIVGALAVYVVFAALRPQPFRLGPIEAPVPPPGIALSQILLGTLDAVFAGLALTLLLDQDPAHVVATLGVFALASTAAAISSIPAGLGSFEAVLLLLSPAANDRMAAALILYRLVYYLIPLTLAVLSIAYAQRRAVLAAAQRAGETAARARTIAQIVARGIAPQASGALVAVAGLILLLSGASPALDARMGLLREYLPLAVIEMSHLTGSLTGFALLVLARGLFARSAAAWHLAMIALAFGAAASLAKGLDFEEAAIMALVMVVLELGRDAFNRGSALFDEPLSPGWVITTAVFVGASVWLGLFAYSQVEYSGDLWWQFEFEGDAPRFLRATLAIALAAFVFALWRLLHPPRMKPALASEAELERAMPIVAASSTADARLALLGDKSLLFSKEGDAFLMYGVQGQSWIAFSDPIGPPERLGELIWTFREMCDARNVRAVYYQVDAANLQRYVDLGFSFLKLGEEARVPLAGFDLAGKKWANVRNTRTRAQKDGATFEVVPAEGMPAVMDELKRVSDDWLKSKGAREKGFTLGFFDERYLARMPCAVLRVEGRIKAFANILMSGGKEEVSVDLMRQADDAPHGAMDFLFAELCFWAKAQGYRWFNLGLAPLSGLEARKLAPAWHKLGGLVFGHGEQFYNFAGLRKYKEKFNPVWRAKYMASPGGLNAAIALSDASALVSRGYTGMFAK